DNDRLLVALLGGLYRRFRPHENGAAAGAVGRRDSGPTDDEAAGREIWPRDPLHQSTQLLVARETSAFFLGFVNRPDDAVDDLAQIVGRDVGGHADGNAGGSVHEQVRNRRGQHRGFFRGLVVVGDEIDRFLVEIGHYLVGQRLQPRFRVTHGRGRIAVDRSEVALPVYERVANVEVLREADERVVNGGVAVRVEVAHHLADDLGAL